MWGMIVSISCQYPSNRLFTVVELFYHLPCKQAELFSLLQLPLGPFCIQLIKTSSSYTVNFGSIESASPSNNEI